MTPFLVILFTLTVLFGKAVWNWYQIEKQNKRPKHTLQMVPVALLMFAIQAMVVRRIEQWELAGTILLFQASIYWFLFDGVLNKMRGKHWLYIGIPDGEDALSDQLFYKLGGSMYLWSKIVMIPLIIYGVIWTYRLM